MKQLHILKRLGFTPLQTASSNALLAVSFALTACGGGGGGGSAPPPEPTVTGVENVASVLEVGVGGTSDLTFKVTFDGPVVNRLELIVSTVSLIKQGFVSTPGAAKGGGACDVDVDYKTLNNESVVFFAGARSGLITVKVCGDATFEPNEALDVTWKPVGGSVKTVSGTIVNDDAGGLNGTGALIALDGLAAFGRDTSAWTNTAEDGPLGFSFDKPSSSSCITDNVTGLTWQRAFKPGLTFAQGQASATTDRGVCGKIDWRIPTVNELLSLMNFSLTGVSSINADASEPMTGAYWSSEKGSVSTNNVWTVVADTGTPGFAAETAMKGVRLVSGGEFDNGSSRATACNDSSRYSPPITVGGVVTVEDKKTGLMWKQCSEGATGDSCTDTIAKTYSTAAAVAQRVIDVNAASATLGAGHADWRVPSVKELASLVDRCAINNAAINWSYFPNTMQASYVSATRDASATTMPWIVNFSGGEIAPLPVGQWSSGLYLRLVRAGQ